MNRDSYRESAENSQMSSQVASWAQNWAEAFRREAWQQGPLEAIDETIVPDSLIKAEKQLRRPLA